MCLVYIVLCVGGYRTFLTLSRSDSLHIEAVACSRGGVAAFDGAEAQLARLPNALYQEGSSSPSRPITPPPTTPPSPWHGRNRKSRAGELSDKMEEVVSGQFSAAVTLKTTLFN